MLELSLRLLILLWLVPMSALWAGETKNTEPEEWQKAGVLAALKDPSEDVLVAAISDSYVIDILPVLT